MRILVLYYSKTGHTLEAVNPMVDGLRSGGSEAEAVNTKGFNAKKISEYDALIVGSPCWGGSIWKKSAAFPVVRALKKLPKDSLKEIRCGGISIHGGRGGEITIEHLRRLLESRGCQDFRPGPVAKAGTAISIGRGPSVKDEDLKKFKEYGSSFAKQLELG